MNNIRLKLLKICYLLEIYRPRIIIHNILKLDTYYIFIISKEYVKYKVPTHNNKRLLA